MRVKLWDQNYENFIVFLIRQVKIVVLRVDVMEGGRLLYSGRRLQLWFCKKMKKTAEDCLDKEVTSNSRSSTMDSQHYTLIPEKLRWLQSGGGCVIMVSCRLQPIDMIRLWIWRLLCDEPCWVIFRYLSWVWWWVYSKLLFYNNWYSLRTCVTGFDQLSLTGWYRIQNRQGLWLTRSMAIQRQKKLLKN